MRQLFLVVFAVFLLSNHTLHSSERTTINLNGTWQFDQTTSAFPPVKFTRTIAVPGLIHLAEPKIADYDKFFQRPADTEIKDQHNLYDLSYKPKYSWYRKTVFIPSDMQGKEAMITIKKSQFVTQVYINGYDLGTSMACFTPVEFPVSRALKYGNENEILIKVGERVWLPSQAAGGTDKEKENYLPGIWDDVELSFSGNIRLNRILALPSVENKKVTVKAQLRNFKTAQVFYGDPMYDSVTVKFLIAEKTTGKVIAERSNDFSSKRDNLTEIEMDIQLPEFTFWTLDNPFLYTITANVEINNKVSDAVTKQFGMRDFTRKGKFFYLNGEKIILRGTNVTLHRFFEDPDCGNLAWDREWVKKFLIDYPKELNWNMMRICVGLVPDFWYDLADENGLLFQNEWMYWQNHGWDEQIREEYTDWVWTDGNHPSIAIWDAINENWDDFIGNILIPELKKLDPTRIWDAGYMSGGLMAQDEMDEPHLYQGRIRELQPGANKDFYPLGKLDFKPKNLQRTYEESPAQLTNEYGWIWLWRNGTPSKLTVEIYEYYLGKNSTPEQNRELQAYWLQLETEWFRSQESLAGVMAFCYLTNNYGYTGDWIIDNIKDLTPSPTLEWFRHAFAPAGVFINLTDERYTKELEPHIPGEQLTFNLVSVNDHNFTKKGKVHVKLFNDNGDVVEQKNLSVELEPYQRSYIPVSIELPRQNGGYTIVAEFIAQNDLPVISRRYIKVGETDEYKYYDL